jgi:hypothetical protein
MPDKLTFYSLCPVGIEVLGQLFVSGPTWDGNLISKGGRDELLKLGLAFRVGGFTTLTEDGLRAAIEWDRTADRNGRWYCKQNSIPWPREK